MIAGYAMLARGGEWIEPRGVQRIDGRAIAAGVTARVVAERTAFWLTDILSDDEARAYVFGRGGSLEFPFKVAAKTGTSQAYHDNWAIGYTREVTVGVWVGNFDRTPLRNSSGVTGAGPIFHDVMMAAVERVRGYVPIDDTTPVAAPTADVHRGEVCALSGMAPGDACPRRSVEWLPADAPLATCTWHHMSDDGLLTVWPTIYETWARKEGRIGPTVRGSDGPTVQRSEGPGVRASQEPLNPRTVGPLDRGRLTIDAPVAGATYLFDPTLRAEFQTLPLRVRGAAPGEVEWFVNDVPVGHASSAGTVRWPMTRGTHAIRARDAAGHSVETRIVVR